MSFNPNQVAPAASDPSPTPTPTRKFSVTARVRSATGEEDNIRETHDVAAMSEENYIRRASLNDFDAAFADEDGKLGLHMQKAKEMTERQNPNKFPENKAASHVLSPLSTFRIRWDIWTVFMRAYVALITPYELGFLGEDWQARKSKKGETGERIWRRAALTK